MKYRLMAVLLCVASLLSGCSRQAEEQKRENSAGTGYGVSQKSAIMMQDLYTLRPGTNREEVIRLLGSPQSFLMAENNEDTYLLSTGETVAIVYNERNKIESALYHDSSGRKQDFFAYLNKLGILTNYHPGESAPSDQEQTPQPETPSVPEPENPVATPGEGGYFSSSQYRYELAEQILKLGEDRETILSAFGKPNGYSSVSFAKDSYLVDAYSMEDGSTLLLDYGYARTKLRAVQQIKGSAATSYLGTWGQEQKPTGYIRYTRNQQVFGNLKKNTKPAEIYRRIGDPDWLEGTADRYRDAYQLLNGAVFYLDFGPNHNSLTAAVLQKGDGTIVNYTLK